MTHVFLFCMLLLFKPGKRVDAIWIDLYNNFMLRKMSIKPSEFYIPFTSLYPRNIIWQIMILITGRPCVFSCNDDNLIFTWIPRMIYITCPKMSDGVLTSLQLGLICISLCLQCQVFILNDLYLIVTVL